MSESQTLQFENARALQSLYVGDLKLLKTLEEELSVRLTTREGWVRIEGEALGFLPGDLKEKIAPYLRPLYDALQDMLEDEERERYIERGIIEIAPLAFMRGRTLNHAFIILDEAQNTTTEQMLMFLTRLGVDSKCVITGDTTQIDLPGNKHSGLIESLQALKDVEGISFCTFGERDVVRHELVRQIVRAYKRHRAGDVRP